ncbi:MAG: coenzyme F390 synthetase [Vulcanimicrobiaceae bacterium]
MNAYERESEALDRELLELIERWRTSGEAWEEPAFDALALRIFAYQVRYNAPYARYCETLGITAQRPPEHWERIPAVPASSFKDAAITTGEASAAVLAFETSGTTGPRKGRHLLENASLYEAASGAGFERAMLADGARLRYFNLVSNPAERPASSLGYMMARVSERYGDARTGWYLREDALLFDALQHDIRGAQCAGIPLMLAGTAFAFVHLADRLEHTGPLALPSGSRIMETGGFKGRSRAIDRSQLYAKLAAALGVPSSSIVAEYGMTELSSQYYDSPASRSGPQRIKCGPPWLRARVVDERGARVPAGTIGSLVHLDLANRSSVVCVSTEDLAAEVDDGFVLLGRDAHAALRGCSLDAEELRAG